MCSTDISGRHEGATVPHDRSPYVQLRERITGGRCPPGALLVPAAVGEDLGMSRTPVREALQRLEFDGLVTKVSRGYVVRVRTEDEVLAICDTRIALDSAAAFAAATRRSEFDLARLIGLFDRAVAAAEPETALRLHNDWHSALRIAAHNPTIVELMERLDAQLAVYDAEESKAQTNLAQIEAEHRDIHDAVVDGDGERARTLMITHQERTRDIRLAAMAAR
ncbi:GntR family transcriptional regulator [Rhodococcus artemisiae]|uniref:GntR family transcriptional regulator n=1 Tax=Rhodococcus artemisiae TaxID=714159 RepID=A0ABU7L6V8_9NOCA|nr:GntR family transcriptional regulator [Rhodococcus artemisiae]MEE2057280.1 GntR family transcriptional regulator [Rhodococcus artemisiae]